MFLDALPEGLAGNLVSCDNTTGGCLYRALSAGRRRIAAPGPNGLSTVAQRLQGYRYALARHGLPTVRIIGFA